ncbi:glycosyltransferase [Bacteroidota bacterium]
MIAVILFWLSIFAIFHSYVLYPALLIILAQKKKQKSDIFHHDDSLPGVSILMSLFNEEEVIREKIESIFSNNYPEDKLEVIVGSDNSTDKTNEIMEKLSAGKYKDRLIFKNFTSRQGKGNIINQLYDIVKGDVLILSDANVIFDVNTIFELARYFKDKNCGLVDTNMINKGLKKEGISLQEKAYISREVLIKNREGLIWGAMMGPFGGCYAIRKELYCHVPPNYLVDDFYINMKILEKNYSCINNLKARVYEDVSNDPGIEFRRKIRIATGNFQNLETFKALLWPPYKGRAFAFLSHKVLRWFGPFFLLIILFTLTYLAFSNFLYLLLLVLYLASLLWPLFDIFLRKIHLHIIVLRFVSHFYSMNLALLIGFYKYLKGVKSNVWEPTKRNQ